MCLFRSYTTGNITLTIQPCGYIHQFTQNKIDKVTEFNNCPDMDRERLQSKIHPSLIDYPDRQIELSIVFAQVTDMLQCDLPQTAEDKLRVAEQLLKPKLFEALALFIEAYSNRERYWENDKLNFIIRAFRESDTLETAEFDWNWDNCAVLIKLGDVKLIIYFSKNGIFYLSELVDCTPLSSFLHPSRSLSKSDLYSAKYILVKMQSINDKI